MGTINDFSKHFRGGVRANLFTCNVSGPGIADRSTEYHCKGTSIPASTIGNIDVPYLGRQLKVPGDRTYADWTVTLFNDKIIDAWRKLEQQGVPYSKIHRRGTSSPGTQTACALCLKVLEI